ncbi:MAG: DUF2378 family protein [Polyangiales bacterium]
MPVTPDAAEQVFEISSSVPLSGALDLDAVADRIPRHHRLKGMFFGRCVEVVRADWAVIATSLDEPAPGARYQAFESYPVRDYQRIFVAAARRAHPSVSSREAVRLYARAEVEAFVGTMLGRVTFSMLSDPTAALLRYPEVFDLLANGPTASARKLGDRLVAVELRDAHAPVEYTVGVLEGIVLAFKRHSRMQVHWTPSHLRIEVRWMV